MIIQLFFSFLAFYSFNTRFSLFLFWGDSCSSVPSVHLAPAFADLLCLASVFRSQILVSLPCCFTNENSLCLL